MLRLQWQWKRESMWSEGVQWVLLSASIETSLGHVHLREVFLCYPHDGDQVVVAEFLDRDLMHVHLSEDAIASAVAASEAFA